MGRLLCITSDNGRGLAFTLDVRLLALELGGRQRVGFVELLHDPQNALQIAGGSAAGAVAQSATPPGIPGYDPSYAVDWPDHPGTVAA